MNQSINLVETKNINVHSFSKKKKVIKPLHTLQIVVYIIYKKEI